MNNSAKNEQLLIRFDTQNPEKISHQKIINLLTSPKIIKIWSAVPRGGGVF